MTLGLLVEGRTEFRKGHVVRSDKAICCSASSSEKVEGGGWWRIPFAGAWREKIFWDITASTRSGNLFFFGIFQARNCRRIFDGEAGSLRV